MSYLADKAREQRHAAAGGVRLHSRISREAAEAFELLCMSQRLEKRQVIERLILEAAQKAGLIQTEALATAWVTQREEALMREFHVGRAEARDVIERGLA